MPGLQGAWPALVTPFTADNKVNASAIKDMVDYHLSKGAGGFYVCGSTGEGVFMSAAERRHVAETVLNHVNGRAPVIVHVGTMVSTEAVDLARHAAERGATAVSSILPPQYTNVEGLQVYFEAIAAAVPDTPVLPYLFGGPTDAVALMRRLMQIPNVAGTKYTGPNMYEFRRIVEMRPSDWTVFSGMDEQCIFAAMSGASGHIGSTLNLMIGAYREIISRYRAGDPARGYEIQAQINRVIDALFSTGRFHGALKAAMKMLGFDCGQPRLPHLPLPEAQWPELRAGLEACGFFALAEM